MNNKIRIKGFEIFLNCVGWAIMLIGCLFVIGMFIELIL